MPKDDRFDGIRELIRKGKYDQARVLLRMMPDDPRAQDWLAKLDRMAPPTPNTTVVNPLEEIDRANPQRRTQPKPNKTWTRIWLALRAFGIILLLCQCVWIIPLLNMLGVMPAAIAELDMPPAVEQTLDTVLDNPVGRTVTNLAEERVGDPIERASENMQDRVMSQGFQQAAPILNQMCEDQGLNAQEEALCKDLMGNMEQCLANGGTLDGCMDRVMDDVCRDYFGGDAYAYNTCMRQMNELKTMLP